METLKFSHSEPIHLLEKLTKFPNGSTVTLLINYLTIRTTTDKLILKKSDNKYEETLTIENLNVKISDIDTLTTLTHPENTEHLDAYERQ